MAGDRNWVTEARIARRRARALVGVMRVSRMLLAVSVVTVEDEVRAALRLVLTAAATSASVWVALTGAVISVA